MKDTLFSRKSIVFLSLNLFAAVVALYVWLFNPAETLGYNVCVLNANTGYYCMTCGGTRALYAFLHCRFADALSFNPFIMLVLLPFSVFMWMQAALYVYAGRSLNLRNNLKIICVILALGFTFCVLRNISSPAFAMLRPHPAHEMSR